MKIMFLVLVLTVTLGGCATPNISNDFDISQAEQSGVVSGTITYQGVYGGYTLHVSSIDGKSRYRLAHAVVRSREHWKGPWITIKSADRETPS